jgi:hypothetical protein
MLLCLALLAQAAAAQSASSSRDDHALVMELVERVRQLEAEVKELRAQLGGRPAASEPQPAPAMVAAPPPEIIPAQSPGMPGMQFRGFADAQYQATDRRGSHHSFAIGQFNLFITSRLSDRVSVLAETVVEAGADNRMVIDLERLLLQYAANDYFNVAIGRYHTAIGWYNTAYHHASWLQTTTNRPFLFAFESQGGVLPIHNVGISATGRIPTGPLGLHYVAEIGNGRASRSRLDETVQNVRDENNSKAVNLGLFARPDAVRGLQVGFSFYHDRLTPEGGPRIRQTILGAHGIYQTSRFEFLNEAMVVRHAIRGTNRTLHTPGFYTQVSRRFRSVRPYFRYQYVNAAAADPMYWDVGRIQGPSAGVRFDFSEFAALKLQYDRMDRRRLEAINGVSTQLSFTF